MESKIITFIKNKLLDLKNNNAEKTNDESTEDVQNSVDSTVPSPEIHPKQDIDKELIEILSNILDKNPEFFILIEKILLDLVKDNELNLTIFNYSYIIDSITKISTIYNNLNLNDLQPLLNNKNYFLKIIKWTIDVVIKNNSSEISNSDIVIEKLNVLINSYKEFINIFKR